MRVITMCHYSMVPWLRMYFLLYPATMSQINTMLSPKSCFGLYPIFEIQLFVFENFHYN